MAVSKVLVIEDEPIHLNVMKTKLEHAGYNVAVAMDGEKGYEMIKTEKPDLVLLDVILPKMNGFEILERSRKDGVKLPIIIVSNSGQPVEIDRAMKLGANDYLVKAEFNPSDVLEKAQKFLGNTASAADSGAGGSAPAVLGAVPAVGDGKAPPSSAAKSKVLVVEDDKFLRDLILQKLFREGFEALQAIDGEEALRVIGEKMPDLVLLDLILPGIDGFEILRRLKADQATAGIPVIVLSNLGQKEDMERAISAGAEDFMVKAHFTPGEIIAKIKSVLAKKKGV